MLMRNYLLHTSSDDDVDISDAVGQRFVQAHCIDEAKQRSSIIMDLTGKRGHTRTPHCCWMFDCTRLEQVSEIAQPIIKYANQWRSWFSWFSTCDAKWREVAQHKASWPLANAL